MRIVRVERHASIVAPSLEFLRIDRAWKLGQAVLGRALDKPRTAAAVSIEFAIGVTVAGFCAA